VYAASLPKIQSGVDKSVGRNFHWRRPSHGERGARAYNGVLGQSPQRGPGAEPPGAEPLVGDRGAKPPLKLKAFQTLDVEKRQQISPVLHFGNLSVISVLFN